MPKGRSSTKGQLSFLESYGHTAPAVPAIREEVKEWVASGYKGATAISRTLLNYWFGPDHKLPNGQVFRYYYAQKEAIETLIYVYEVAKTHSINDFIQRFIPADLKTRVTLPSLVPFPRYCTKMATGSGKTKVMSLAIAWQYFNAVVESDDTYAKTFLIIAPNVIVFERLKDDFGGGRIFKTDPLIPKEFQVFWEMQFYMRGEAERSSSLGAVYLTNIQQLYSNQQTEDDEPDIMTAVLGSKPPSNLNEADNFRERMAKRDERVLIINDEAHHTHDPNNAWNTTIQAIHEENPLGLSAQLDFSATPRYSGGGLFAWTISDYTLKQAINQFVVKRPVKGVTDIGEVSSNVPHVKYEPFITAGVERWREYREQLAPLGKKPLLFIMMNKNDEADSIGHYLQSKYPSEFGGDKTLVIHTGRDNDVSKQDLEVARKAAREVDRDESTIHAIVSVLMLREGWDVQNVTVVVGLRPYTATANILPEQTIGRGLRLMFRNVNSEYKERVDIIGNKGFLKFIDDLEKEEGFKLDTWDVGKEKLSITVIQPVAEQAAFDIALPILSPILGRSTSISDFIEQLDIMAIPFPRPLPRKPDSQEARQFRYEGMDIITLEKLFERVYTIPTPQTSQEIIGYLADVISQEIKLPSQFHLLFPKVRDFLKYKAFGGEVDLDSPEILQAISHRLTKNVVLKVFVDLLREKLIEPQVPKLEGAGLLISGIEPFPWSQIAPLCSKTVLNKVPCDNKFEEEFARFLANAMDVAKFSKLPMQLGFTIPYTDVAGNLRHYYPDFVVVDTDDVHYIVETKGREDTDVKNKDRSATMWAASATELTGVEWKYVKVMQRDFIDLQPVKFDECVYYGQMQASMFDDVF